MKVGILGGGEVGRSLGRGFVAHGHEVMISSRDVTKPELKEWGLEVGSRGHVGTYAEAAKHGDLLVLATAGVAAEAVIDLAGTNRFDGKVLIDVTNPIEASKGMPPGLFVGTSDSLGERIQRKLPKAKVVKAFNIVNNQTMIRPKMKDGIPDMLIAGNDGAAKKTVAGLLRDFGWPDPIDVGGIEGARWLEAWVPLWVRVCQGVGSWSVAIKVLRT